VRATPTRAAAPIRNETWKRATLSNSPSIGSGSHRPRLADISAIAKPRTAIAIPCRRSQPPSSPAKAAQTKVTDMAPIPQVVSREKRMPSARFGRFASAAMILPIVLSKRLRGSGELERPDARRDETPQSRARPCAVSEIAQVSLTCASNCGEWRAGPIADLCRPRDRNATAPSQTGTPLGPAGVGPPLFGILPWSHGKVRRSMTRPRAGSARLAATWH
jgi:hypothetical protein